MDFPFFWHGRCPPFHVSQSLVRWHCLQPRLWLGDRGRSRPGVQPFHSSLSTAARCGAKDRNAPELLLANHIEAPDCPIVSEHRHRRTSIRVACPAMIYKLAMSFSGRQPSGNGETDLTEYRQRRDRQPKERGFHGRHITSLVTRVFPARSVARRSMWRRCRDHPQRNREPCGGGQDVAAVGQLPE